MYEFKEFINGFFDEISDKRANDIIYKRFGIQHSRVYTLDEIGLLYKGISRERVRQIEAQTIKKIQLLLHGEEIRKINYICDSAIIEKFSELKRHLVKEEACVLGLVINEFDLDKIEIGWIYFLLKLADVKLIKVDILNDELILNNSINVKAVIKELKKTLEIIKKNVIYIRTDDLIIKSKKGRRTFDEKYIYLAIKCLESSNIVIENDNSYAIAFGLIASAGDMAHRVLSEKRTSFE